jgi:hypothetical protein
MSNWFVYNDGDTTGGEGTEGGIILRDEEHEQGARLTLKRGESFFAVSCSIRGWMDHTRFFATELEAQREYLSMKPPLANMLENILSNGKGDLKMWEAIADFVRRYP